MPTAFDIESLDFDLCALDVFGSYVSNAPAPALQRLADHCPRKIPPKQRRNLVSALIRRWAYADAHDYYLHVLENAMLPIQREVKARHLRAVAWLGTQMPWPAVLWIMVKSGYTPRQVWRQLKAKEKAACVEHLEWLAGLRDACLQERQAAQEYGNAAVARAARKEVERTTKGLRWLAERAQAKQARASQATQKLVAEYEEKLAKAIAERDSERQRVIALEAEVAHLRRHLERTERATPVEEPDRTSARGRLSGMRVLVVGDEQRQEEYKAVIAAMGGDAEFVSGFGSPRLVRERAGSADLVVLVTAAASHKVSGAITASGTPYVYVPNAGIQSFRHALLTLPRGGAVDA